MPRPILFLCTGNYYRSRFAEELFNHLARQSGLDAVATSRALAIERGTFNIGPISAHTRRGLARLGVPLAEPVRHPLPCDEADLQQAAQVIALKEAEHRPYLTDRFPGWADRVTYWHVHDLDQAGSEEALAQIEQLVRGLVGELAQRRDGAAGG